MKSEYVQDIHSKALRCRELARTASDAEVAEELLRLAGELETALHLLGQNSEGGPDAVSGLKGRSSSKARPDIPVQAS